MSHDQVFSEPILKDFEKDTGIKVRAIYDTEESKSTGAMNRLIAEKNNPQADVYWANEPVRAEVLRQKGIAAAYSRRTPKGFRRSSGIPMATGRVCGKGTRSHCQRNTNPKPDSVLRTRPAVARQNCDRKSAVRHDNDANRRALRAVGR